MFGRQVTKLVTAIIFICALLFTLFPAEYVRQFSLQFPFEPLDRLALKLTDFHARNNFKYGCDNPVYFGYKTPFSVKIPGIADEEQYHFSTEQSEHLAYFFVSDINLNLNWAASGQEIETYNLMILDKCIHHQVS